MGEKNGSTISEERCKRRLVLGAIVVMSLIVALCIVTIPSDEPDVETNGECGIGLTWSLNGTELTISYTGGPGIMDDYDSGNSAPWGTDITSVHFGKENGLINRGIRTIGSNAFSDCSELTSIAIPASVRSIGEHAFKDTNMKSITFLGDMLTATGGNIVGFTNYLFQGSDGDSLDGAVSHSTYMSDPETPKRLILQDKACGSGLTYAIADNVLTISYSGLGTGEMFDYSEFNNLVYGKNIASVIIGEGVTYIGKCSFTYCKSLASVTMPASVKTIGDSAFLNSDGLKSIDIPNVTTIEGFAFMNCTSLESVNMPNVTGIGDSAFTNCKSLASVTMPASIITIEANAFVDTDLKSITFLGDTLKATNGEISGFTGYTFYGTGGKVLDGDVHHGTYAEDPVVSKKMVIQGESKSERWQKRQGVKNSGPTRI